MAKKRVKGLFKLKQQLNNKFKEIDKDLKSILQDYTLRIEYQAKRLAPTDMGHLGQSISSKVYKYIHTKGVVSANANYAPFVEFGTGAKAKIPIGFEKLALRFKGKKRGNFDTFLENIKGWCKRKGIDEKNAYVIAVSILKKGIMPQPFLIPSYLEQKIKYELAVKKYKNEIRW